MPDPIDEFFGDDGESGDDDGESGETKTPSTPPKDQKSTDKRISDLQSAKDKETARANKAEKQLKALLSASGGDEEPMSPAPAGDVNSAILEMARMFAVQQNPKLAEYEITASELSGNTPAEIAKSAAELVAKYEKIETRARNKALAANGLAPELEGAGAPPKDRDFSTMSREDFKKLMDAAMSGGLTS